VVRAFALLVGSRGEPTAELRTVPDRARLLAELDQLPSMQKATVVLRYGHDMSLDEIAATLGVSGETVKTHLKRAFARLRLRLGVADGDANE
jgi:RNA polymerase sigma factor (sigma-70 family)